MMKDKEGNSYTADGEGNITISASKSITLCVGENKIMIDSEGNISSNAEKDITESAGANIAQSAENIDCTAGSNYNISSTDFTATGSSSATVSGTTKANDRFFRNHSRSRNYCQIELTAYEQRHTTNSRQDALPMGRCSQETGQVNPYRHQSGRRKYA